MSSMLLMWKSRIIDNIATITRGAIVDWLTKVYCLDEIERPRPTRCSAILRELITTPFVTAHVKESEFCMNYQVRSYDASGCAQVYLNLKLPAADAFWTKASNNYISNIRCDIHKDDLCVTIINTGQHVQTSVSLDEPESLPTIYKLIHKFAQGELSDMISQHEQASLIVPDDETNYIADILAVLKTIAAKTHARYLTEIENDQATVFKLTP